MEFRRFLIISALLFPAFLSYSQTDSLAGTNYVSSNISFAFNGSLIYPGLRTGIEIPVYTVCLTSGGNSENSKSVIKNRFAAIDAGWYHHPDFHDNLYFTTEWRMRRTRKGGFFLEFSPGIGYSRTFLGGTTYVVNKYGEVKIDRLAGYNYALVTVGGGAGYSFSEKKGIPLSAYYRFNVLLMFPYNSTMYFRPAMELGLIFKPAKFIPVRIKKRIIEK